MKDCDCPICVDKRKDAELTALRARLAEVEGALRKARNTLAGCGMGKIAADICDDALASAGEVPERLMDLDRAEEVRRILIRVAKFTQMKLDMGSIGRKPLQDILDLCAGKVPEWMAEIEANESQIPELAMPTPTGEAQDDE